MSQRLVHRGEYPPDWDAIGDQVRAENGNRCIRCGVNVARNAYRRAAANTHPDTNGGSTGNFQLTQEAKRVLGAHFGVTL